MSTTIPVSGLQMCYAKDGKVERLNIIGFSVEDGAVALLPNACDVVTAHEMLEDGIQVAVLPANASRSIVMAGVKRQGGVVDEVY